MPFRKMRTVNFNSAINPNCYGELIHPRYQAPEQNESSNDVIASCMRMHQPFQDGVVASSGVLNVKGREEKMVAFLVISAFLNIGE